MEIIKRNPKELIKADYNPRKISDKDFKQLKKSLETFQCVEPIVVNQFEGRENVIVGGHQRLKAMLELGWDEVPTIEVYLELEEEKELNVRLNKNTGEFDFELLTDLFDTDKLEEIGFDLDELPEITEDLTEPLTDPDEAPEPPKEPKTKLGDIYELGNHRLMCGDSTSIDAVEKLMDGEKADLLHTDPPYNVDYDNSKRPKAGKDLGKIKNDKMTSDEFYSFLYDFYLSSFTVMKDGSSAYIWHADRETINFKQSALDSGFVFAQTIIWKKPMLLSRTRYQWAHEPCLFLTKGSPYFTDDRTKTTVWDFGGYDKSKNVHPTQKPTFIPKEAILNSSKQGSNVLDLFGGSGSTLIACEETGRKARLMELDPKYCDVIVERWENFTGKKAKLISNGGE